MNSKIYKCTIGAFSIVDGFEIVDALFEEKFLSVSCVEKNNKWHVEILSETKISKSDVAHVAEKYNYLTIEICELEDINWLEKCFESFKPITVGDFYVFGPHLREKQIPKNKICIEIAAATAFGTGEHSTTNRCLLACKTFFDSKIHRSILDIGCGSGILSIALAKLGASCVDAYDNDPEAVKVSSENIKINRVEHCVSVYKNSRYEFALRKYDFVVANILAAPLIEMSEYVIKSMNPNGILVLSGFNSSDNSVVDKYESSCKLSKKYTYNHENFSTVVFQNSSSMKKLNFQKTN